MKFESTNNSHIVGIGVEKGIYNHYWWVGGNFTGFLEDNSQ